MAELPLSIDEEMKASYLDYAMSVIVGRALPDVRDGLKPVHRRILYAMLREGLLPGKKFSKCAGVVGEVLKKYHPHGDSAVYDALVRIAQDFVMRYMLVDGQGNFGSVDGDPPAAYRYTEARLTAFAEEMLVDLDKETVDYLPNFDGTTQEPSVLPSRVPNLIVNGSSGIAVGMATNIPPHNLGEIVDAILYMLEHPDAGLIDIMRFVKGPDFPTSGIIYGRAGIMSAYSTGRGLIKMRAKTEIELAQRGENIIVTELPYQVNKAKLIEKIAALVREKKIEGLYDLRDESDREGMRIVIELKKGALSQIVLNQLFKHTAMESTFGVIMLALVDGRPRVLSLLEVLSYYLDHRKEVITRRTRFELKKAEERAHILEGLKIALDNIDEIITIIRSSKTPATALEALMARFPLSKIQAQAILDMRLQRLTGLERDKIIEEYEALLKEIERLKAILGDESLVRNIIRDDLKEIRKKYADERRTAIVEETGEIGVEDLIHEEDVVITISHTGYIKRSFLSEYRSQRRGGKGLKGMETREEDFVEKLFLASTHDKLLFITNKGKMFQLMVYQLPQIGRTAKGTAIVNLLQLDEGETVATVLPIKEFTEGKYIFMATKRGYVKKTDLMTFHNLRVVGLNAIRLDEGDGLIGVTLTDGTKDICLSTKEGLSIRFSEEDVRDMGRTARGVRGVDLRENDEVVSLEVLEENKYLLIVTEKGYGKRTPSEAYRKQSRGGKGIKTIKTSKRNGKVVGILQVSNEDDVVIITSSGKLIRTSVAKISVTGRIAVGVTLINLAEDDRVVSIDRVAEQDDDPAAVEKSVV
ncbi:MAG TPA: DNA gyrase subunit A, partial [Thermodesulfovibrionia bacterium]|nr:DNA gyrase subunit A [Thermodesulfovibrionia bacterium]